VASSTGSVTTNINWDMVNNATTQVVMGNLSGSIFKATLPAWKFYYASSPIVHVYELEAEEWLDNLLGRHVEC
jgi:hypothetical protein